MYSINHFEKKIITKFKIHTLCIYIELNIIRSYNIKYIFLNVLLLLQKINTDVQRACSRRSVNTSLVLLSPLHNIDLESYNNFRDRHTGAASKEYCG